MKDIAIYGAGGFGREMACVIKQINESSSETRWNFIGYFDDGVETTDDYPYGPILGGMETVNAWTKPLDIIIAIGTPKTLKIVAEKITNPLIDFPNIIAPSAVMYEMPTMGKGNIITANCLFTVNVSVGSFNVFNLGTMIPHDVSMGDYNLFNPYVNISGNVKIGSCNLFGVKSTIIQGLTVGDNNNIGACSVILDNVGSNKNLLGNPAIDSILVLKEYFKTKRN